MNENGSHNPYEYFYKHATEKPSDIPETFPTLEMEVFPLDILDKGGEVHVNTEGYSYSLTYSPYDLGKSRWMEAVRLRIPNARDISWFKIDNLTLTDNHENGKTINTTNFLPSFIPVIFPQHDSGGNCGWRKHSTDKEEIIFLGAPPNTPEIILSLLHEIGHHFDRVDHERREENKQPFFDPKHKMGAAVRGAETLNTERNSWAWALKQIRSFSSPHAEKNNHPQLFPRTEVVDFAKKRCLESYRLDTLNKANMESAVMRHLLSEIDWWMGGYEDEDQDDTPEIVEDYKETS